MGTATSLLPPIAGVHRDDLVKPSVIIALTLVAILLTVYSIQHWLGDFLFVLYLIPLVLASVWYPRYGLVLIVIVVMGSLITIIYTSWSGLSPNPLLYSLYTALFVWIIAVITVSTMEGRTSLARTMDSLRRLHHEPHGRQAGESGKAGDSGSPLLSDQDLGNVMEALSLPDPAAREGAIRTLGRSGNPRAVAPLISLLGDVHRGTREQAVRALGSLGEVAVEPLIQALSDPDWHVRTGAAVALRIIGDPRAIDPLVRLLSDSNRFV
ncbi:MAG: HEAT repeat domain-containing protein, partial [Methanomicrobiales archaeon]|nr:HEAT repeat domain-containing protein [Methanomicrobiales archaeon]